MLSKQQADGADLLGSWGFYVLQTPDGKWRIADPTDDADGLYLVGGPEVITEAADALDMVLEVVK